MSFQSMHLMIHGSIINSGWPHTIFSESSTRFLSPSPATIKLFRGKLQRGLFSASRKDVDGKTGGATMVPNDVKKGHFAVVAVKGGKPKRFVLELGYLSNPEFLSLLEQAEEEYGFQQKGVLAVPCPPEELQNVLKYNKRQKNQYGMVEYN